MTQAVSLRSQIQGLEAEAQALLKEQEAISQRITSLRQLLAAQEREKEAITLEYNTKKAAYEAFRARYDQIANLSGADLAFDNPNPEYQRLRSALIDAQAEEARLLARKAAPRPASPRWTPASTSSRTGWPGPRWSRTP